MQAHLIFVNAKWLCYCSSRYKIAVTCQKWQTFCVVFDLIQISVRRCTAVSSGLAITLIKDLAPAAGGAQWGPRSISSFLTTDRLWYVDTLLHCSRHCCFSSTGCGDARGIVASPWQRSYLITELNIRNRSFYIWRHYLSVDLYALRAAKWLRHTALMILVRYVTLRQATCGDVCTADQSHGAHFHACGACALHTALGCDSPLSVSR